MTDKTQDPAAFLTPADLARRYGVTKSTINRWTRDGVLPAPIRINDTTPRWHASALQAWEVEQMGGE